LAALPRPNDNFQPPKNSNAVWASHPDRIGTWIPVLPLSPLSGGMTASARQRSEGTPHLLKPVATRDLAITSDNHCGGQQALSCSRSGGGGRNARATSRVSAFLEIPRRFTLANHRLPLALPQSSGKLRTLTFSLHSLSGRTGRLAIQKKSAPVQNLWMFGLPCGRTRKTERNLRALLTRA